MREAVAQSERPVMLYSIGKDSSVMLHLARKAFYPSAPPFPLLHVDTTWKFREMYAFREQAVADAGMDLLVHVNPDCVERGINPFDHGSAVHTDLWKTEGLKQALDAHRFDVAFGGARRDEERSRAKERVFSVRSRGHGWDPKRQRPELWRLYDASRRARRDGPSVPAVELDRARRVAVHPRTADRRGAAVLRRHRDRSSSATAQLIMVDDERFPLEPERGTAAADACGSGRSGAIRLPARSRATRHRRWTSSRRCSTTRTSERQGRMIDHDSSGSMESKKQQGYF